MNAIGVERRTTMRGLALTAALMSGLVLASCQSIPTGEFNNIDKAQGLSENIASLSAVIQRNPQDPEGYNVRGSAYGRAGQYQAALKDFDQAIQLNRSSIRPTPTVRWSSGTSATRPKPLPTTTFDADQPELRRRLYRPGQHLSHGRPDQEAFSDFPKAIELETTDGRAYHNRGLIYQSQGQHEFAIEDFSNAISLSPNSPSPITAADPPISP